MSTSVLYDAPGPRARRRAVAGSLVALVVLLALLAVVGQRLADNGQFESEKWSSLLSPSDERFSRVWELLGGGIRATVQAAAISIVLSLVIGTVIAVARVSAGRVGRVPLVALVELLRGIPVVILIFFASKVLPAYGVDLDLLWYLVIGLTAYNSVVFAEIIRAGLDSLPRGQTEASYAVGLSRGQALRLVLLPQAFRVMLPALISQLVVVLKDTSLGAFILYVEVVRQANILIQTLDNPIQMYVVIGAMFILANSLLSLMATRLERRLSGSTAGRGAKVATGAATGE